MARHFKIGKTSEYEATREECVVLLQSMLLTYGANGWNQIKDALIAGSKALQATTPASEQPPTIRKVKVYIAGPMTGYENFNYDAFNAAAEQLRARGYEVFNPAENDKQGEDFQSKDWSWYMRQSLKQIAEVDVVYRLDGWQESKGAVIEIKLALQLGIEVRDYLDITADLIATGESK